jgi:alcohol dehydrogenase
MIYEAFGAVPVVGEVPEPEPSPGGVVVTVEATGLCRSDWHGWMGHDDDIRSFPHVPGHEFAGVVVAAGGDVRAWRPGDRVAVPFVCACGRCGACAAGDQQVCERQTQPGFTHWGSFAEQVAVENADVNLVAMPEDLSFTVAAALGCRFATAFRAVVAQGGVRPGEWVAVHGCGGVGLSAVMIAAASGARVVAVDVAASALDLAAEFGATACVRATGDAAVADEIRELTGGGAHVSLDALGSPGTCADSVLCLRRRGRHVQVGLLPAAEVPMGRVISYELALLGSHGMAAHAYPEMLALVTAGTLRPDRMVTRVIGLHDAPEALRTMGSVPGVTMIEPFRR